MTETRNKDNIINVGIIGAGIAAQKHLLGYKSCDNVCVAAVVDTQASRARTFAQMWGIPNHYDSLQQFLKHTNTQLVSVCTPVSDHMPSVVACADAGLHILCEKPLAINLTQADAMIETCHSTGRTFAVGFHQRYHPLLHQIHQLIRLGGLGKVHLLQGHKSYHYELERLQPPSWYIDPKRAGGGALFEFASHHFDLSRYLLGETAGVQAWQSNSVYRLDVEDHGVALLAFVKGAMGTLSFTWTNVKGHDNELRVYGETGMCKFSSYNGDFAQLDIFSSRSSNPLAEQLPNSDIRVRQYSFAGRDRIHHQILLKDNTHPIIHQVRDVIRCIRTGDKPRCTGEDARATLALTLAVTESAKQRGQFVQC